MAIGMPPFYHSNQNIMYQYICSKNPIFPDPNKYKIYLSDSFKDIILNLLKKDPS